MTSKGRAISYIRYILNTNSSHEHKVFDQSVVLNYRFESVLNSILDILREPEPAPVRPDRDKPWRKNGLPVGNSKYRFTNPIRDAEETLYFKILKQLFWQGPMSKRDIWKCLGFSEYTIEDWAVRNQYTGLFSAMQLAKLIKYDKSTNCWSLGDNFYLWRNEVIPLNKMVDNRR